MAGVSAPLTAKKRRRLPTQAEKPTRRSARIPAIEESLKFRTNTEQQAGNSIKQEKLSAPQQVQDRPVKTRKRTRGPDNHTSNERRRKRLQTGSPLQTTSELLQQAERQKRRREAEVPPALPQPSRKRARTRPLSISEARVEHWTKNTAWPTEEQEKEMQRFQENYVRDTLPRRKSSVSLRRKRSEGSITSEQNKRGEKATAYRHPQYEREHRERGSFMEDDEEGISVKSKELCRKLLTRRKSHPEGTVFSDERLFLRTCRRLRGENETKVILDIGSLIVPRAEPLADRGAKHLEILRETTDALWTNAIPFYGSRPWPDYGLGFKREAFKREYLQKLKPFIGNEADDCSFVAVTPNMYYPFLTAEVKSEAAALVFSDRQNLGNMTTALQDLAKLYRLAGREKELHREIKGWSISYGPLDIRIWGHYLVIDGKDQQYRRRPIAMINIESTELDEEQENMEKRWIPHDFVMNLYDLWVQPHFEEICSVINMVPDDLDFEVPELVGHPSAGQNTTSSGLSQQLEDHGLIDDPETPGSQQGGVQQVTPETTIRTEPISKRKKKTKR